MSDVGRTTHTTYIHPSPVSLLEAGWLDGWMDGGPSTWTAIQRSENFVPSVYIVLLVGLCTKSCSTTRYIVV